MEASSGRRGPAEAEFARQVMMVVGGWVSEVGSGGWERRWGGVVALPNEGIRSGTFVVNMYGHIRRAPFSEEFSYLATDVAGAGMPVGISTQFVMELHRVLLCVGALVESINKGGSLCAAGA